MNKSFRKIFAVAAAFAVASAAVAAEAVEFVTIGTGPTGGTYYTVRLAQEKGIQVINLAQRL